MSIIKHFLSAVLFICLITKLDAAMEDPSADQLIAQCLSSDKFSNTLINYKYGNTTYPIRIIHNPKKELLMSDRGYSDPISSEILAGGPVLPYSLIRHLEKKFPSLTNMFSFINPGPSAYYYSFFKPVYIANTFDDPLNTAVVARVLSSTTFQNEVIYYFLENKYYRIRILYNPLGLSFKSTRRFNLGVPLMREMNIDLTWNKKYAIVTDKKAPKELIDYLSKCLNCSWREWYFNFDVRNGSSVLYDYREFNGTNVVSWEYCLDTYFHWMSDFVPGKTN